MGFLAYGNVVRHPFVHDDVIFILYNPHIADLRNLWSIFLEPFWLASASSLINLYHRPLLEVVYRLEYALFGFDASGYHLLNILLHIANAVYLLAILSRIFRKGNLPLLASIFFLIHPIQTEAVACISGISNLLSAFFILGSFYIYLSVRQGKAAASFGFRYFLSFILFILALLTKEQMIIFPLLLVCYEWYSSDSSPAGKRRYIPAAAFFLISIAYILLRKVIVGEGMPNLLANPLELGLRILAIPQTLLMYGQLLIFPVDLHYYRSTDVLASSWSTPIVFLFVLLTMGGVIYQARGEEKKRLIFGLAWFFIFLFPTLNIVPLIIEYSHISTAEHFLYLPMAGSVVFFLTAIERPLKFFLKNWRQRAGLLAGVVIILLAATARQNTYWRGEIPLFERTTHYEKKMARVYILLAKAYYFDGRMDQASAAYHQALRIVQRYLQEALTPSTRNYYLGLAKGIYFDLANCYEQKGDFLMAVRQYASALRIDPRDSVIYNNLGRNYWNIKNYKAAVSHFQKALELNPKNFLAMNNLALCYIEEGRWQEAEVLLREALAINNQFIPAQKNLESLLHKASRQEHQPY